VFNFADPIGKKRGFRLVLGLKKYLTIKGGMYIFYPNYKTFRRPQIIEEKLLRIMHNNQVEK